MRPMIRRRTLACAIVFGFLSMVRADSTAVEARRPNPSSFDVALSRDGGSTFSKITGCTNLTGALRSCSWTPSNTSPAAQIRVTARQGGASVADRSNASFVIVDP